MKYFKLYMMGRGEQRSWGYLDDVNHFNFAFIASYLLTLQRKKSEIKENGFKILNIHWLGQKGGCEDG